MRFQISLIMSAALMQLAACGSYREHIEKVSVHGQRFDIPRGCTGTAWQNISQHRISTDTLLIRMRLPDAECPPASTVNLVDENDLSAEVLVTDYGKGVREDQAQDAIFKSLTIKSSDLVQGSVQNLQSSAADSHFKFAVGNLFSVDTKHVWRSRVDPKSYLICTHGWKPENPHKVRRCEHYFNYRGLRFKLSYSMRWAPQWHHIELAVKNKFNSFSRSAG